MSLVPKISISTNNKCNAIAITEKTDVFVLGTNEGGWGGPNIDTDDIVSAILEINDLEGNTLETIDILPAFSFVVTAPTPGAFVAYDNIVWENLDGIYELVYTITSQSKDVFVNNITHELILCNLCNCLQALIVKMLDACDTKTVQTLKTQVDQIEIFIYGIKSAFSCADYDTASSILEAATTYCKTLSDCSCGCGGC
jgi:hypothetical protein